MLDSYRNRVDGILTPISKAFIRWNPNTISVLSLVFAGIAGISYFLGYPAITLIMVILSALFDAIDGKLARLKGVSSKLGDFIDHSFDRFSDIFLILGFAFSRFGNVYLGLFALIGVLMTSYLGTQAQALGLNRLYAGLMGRADRLVIMIVFIILQIFVGSFYRFNYISLTPTNILLIIFGLFGTVTVVQRFLIIYGKLRDQ
ncbi:CDP-alcohol phosphatidyltransferase family protein [Thermoplasma sp. Kam2015]|uniref:CDP-alcohol phosphatidyltransferase family protein n=1 Tax=Thermoplasma sp. Kam2015 TaxID=2094122 RepID=UPI000D9EA1DD|nr:CDP-alcohol phosphatidyltransferase family protein [Thermoplasma sp. Kam2015]PYB68824.1 CDP-alcohol phosphatidyltransferase family protein [Thermoplasma sp. Kam2015]